MSVFRRLYNVAYGKVRSWGSDDRDTPDDLGRSGEGVRSSGTGSVAEESVERLREQLGRLQAESELGRAGVRTSSRIDFSDEDDTVPVPEPRDPEEKEPAEPRQRKL